MLVVDWPRSHIYHPRVSISRGAKWRSSPVGDDATCDQPIRELRDLRTSSWHGSRPWRWKGRPCCWYPRKVSAFSLGCFFCFLLTCAFPLKPSQIGLMRLFLVPFFETLRMPAIDTDQYCCERHGPSNLVLTLSRAFGS